MIASVEDGRVCLRGAVKNNQHLASLPSASWDKREMKWTYFASPIAAARLDRTLMKLVNTYTSDEPFQELLDDFERARQSVIWKQPPGIQAVKEMLDQGINPFFTTTVPWVHQVCADSFLYGKPAALLAMEMGTGKTLCAIQRILATRVMKTLVVAPLAVCEVWPEEWSEHTDGMPHELVTLDQNGSPKRAKKLHDTNIICTAQGRKLIIIVNYESFWREAIKKEILSTAFDMVIYDEIHKLKSPSGKASKFAARLVRQIPNRLGLSGTPLPNNPMDGFGVWRSIDPAMFGTVFTRYRSTYARMGGYQGKVVIGWRNQDRFKRIMDLGTFRVDIDVLDLPEATDTSRQLVLDDDSMVTYRQMEKEFVVGVSTGVVTASNALSRLVKLREITCGFIIDDDGDTTSIHHLRDALLADVLEEIGDEPVVVFCEFKEDVERIKEVCVVAEKRYGEVTGAAKDTVGGKFPPDTDILICNTRSGGLGLNLVAARFAIFYSVGFSLSDHLQARRRVHRGGQYKTVTYIHLVARGTVDEHVYKALRDKKEVIDDIMNAIKGGQYGI